MMNSEFIDFYEARDLLREWTSDTLIDVSINDEMSTSQLSPTTAADVNKQWREMLSVPDSQNQVTNKNRIDSFLKLLYYLKVISFFPGYRYNERHC